MQGGRMQMAWLDGQEIEGPGIRNVRIPAPPPEARLLSGFFRVAFEQTNDAMLAVGSDGRVLDANASACLFFELSREQLLRATVHELIRPDALGAIGGAMGAGGALGLGVTAASPPSAEGTAGEGSVFPAVCTRESAIVRGDGTERGAEVTLRSHVVPDVHLLVMRDRAERRGPTAHLLRADRLSTFGMLAAGVAHEINNPLMYAMTNLRSVLRRIPELEACARTGARADLVDALEEMGRMLATADEGIERVGTLVRDLRISSRESDQRERIDVRSILESCLNIAHGEIRQRARVVRDYADISNVEGNSGRLGQVFLNLLVNAAQAIPEQRVGGEIRVVTRSFDDACIAVEIHDNGLGIEPHMIHRIFEPFFTTKAAGEGTGLGLYIARAIVHEMGGRIEAESNKGLGTMVRVVLPQAPQVTTATTGPR
ncbi:nitrogen regulation protein NR(II) [Pendulispora albinea]|uniref:histidine kinase n=1 Tax=Pendulispora albinea TaxID=2741071 RepID=A0ABZ2LUX4_9BACT